MKKIPVLGLLKMLIKLVQAHKPSSLLLTTGTGYCFIQLCARVMYFNIKAYLTWLEIKVHYMLKKWESTKCYLFVLVLPS
jgi:hypothetical protein